MNNLINPLSLGKVVNVHNLTQKKQLVLFSKLKTSISFAIYILTRKIEFKHSVIDQQK